MLNQPDRPAEFSQDRVHRYVLRRKVSIHPGTCLFIMLNPSTATETANDPTVIRCMGFARSWMYGSLVVVNLFALRSSKPSTLYQTSKENAVGPETDQWIRREAVDADLIVLAWGTHGNLFGRADSVEAMLEQAGLPLYCLGVTQKGLPRHPLYLPKDQILRLITEARWG